MDRVITDAGAADAEWLTGVLARSDTLRSGRVQAVRHESAGSSWSRNARLELEYDADAEGLLPPSLFLKICAERQAVFDRSEVDYYTRDYTDLEEAPLPRCYDAAYREEPRAYHLLLEDLSATHCDRFRRTPTLELGCASAEALARLHTHYWGAELLAAQGCQVAGEAEFARYLGHVGKGLAPLLALAADDLTPAWRERLVALFDRHAAVALERARYDSGFTLLHGDVNPGNVLAPRRGPGAIYLIDRQPFDWSLRCWLAASDLAIMMVLYWETDHRQRFQWPVLRHYHACLDRRGVDYSWDQLVQDYRFSIAQCLESAVEWCVLPADREEKRWLWERQLRRSMAAWEELDCDELWSPGRG